jgi:hypothetical protein
VRKPPEPLGSAWEGQTLSRRSACLAVHALRTRNHASRNPEAATAGIRLPRAKASVRRWKTLFDEILSARVLSASTPPVGILVPSQPRDSDVCRRESTRLRGLFLLVRL